MIWFIDMKLGFMYELNFCCERNFLIISKFNDHVDLFLT
jgi:hypothetical protein